MTLVAYRGRCPRCGREDSPIEMKIDGESLTLTVRPAVIAPPITDPVVIEAAFAADFEAEGAPGQDRGL